MMTEIGEEQRIAFVEYIAHLSAKSTKTLDDLVNLGFIPRALADSEENKNIVVPVLAEMLETLYGSGGGATGRRKSRHYKSSKARVGELSNKLEALSKEYPLQLPPYFVLILRAFGTLEGLGLSTDENYAIVDQCFSVHYEAHYYRTIHRE